MTRRLNIADAIALESIESKQKPAGGRRSHGDWIKILRLALRMPQKELARRARVDQAHLARIEGGKANPEVRTLERIYRALSCELVIEPRPTKPIDEIIHLRAKTIATKRVRQSMGTMALEGQAPGREVVERLIEQRAKEIALDPHEDLWRE